MNLADPRVALYRTLRVQLCNRPRPELHRVKGDVKVTGKNRRHSGLFLLFFTLVFSLVFTTRLFAQDTDCDAARAKWEQSFSDLRNRLQDFNTIQQTPVDKLTHRPVLDKTNAKTIARQVAEALAAKEELLNSKRKECHSVMNMEAQTFNEIQDCVKGAKDKELKNLLKKRQAFVDKAVITLTEVKEVEGTERNSMAYAENAQDDPYRRNVNNYWQSYQQMYRRWWGH